MKYKIIDYSSYGDRHSLVNEDGLTVSADLFVSSSFEGMENLDFDSVEDRNAQRRGLVGKIVDIELVDLGIAYNIKLVND